MTQRLVSRLGEGCAAEEPPTGIIFGQGRVRPELVKAREREEVLRLGVMLVRILFPSSD
jgi:hypothetical protein